ncbi:MAG: hypothetical protein Q9160_007926 [Pyrenula sp. 1 TL-2023]
MSEYWKSTVKCPLIHAPCGDLLSTQPKYWCKQCSTYVKDTKFERTQHEATAKHQGNLKRALRDIHRGHEQDERDKQRAKAEIDRLNRVVSGTPLSKPNAANDPRLSRIPAAALPAPTTKATPAERKRQLAQLADMGIAIPDEFRADMAMAGEWKTMSEQSAPSDIKSEDVSTISSQSIGVRKRKPSQEEDDQDVGNKIGRKIWGSSVRMYPGSTSVADADVEALLTGHGPVKRADSHDPGVKTEERETDDQPEKEIKRGQEFDDTSHTDALIKQETDQHFIKPDVGNGTNDATPDVIFKKRRSRPTKQR